MPAKNVVKNYSAECYYHVYNRGVNKRRIFTDDQDYKTFLSYLKIYLCPQNTDDLKKILGNPEATPKQKDDALKALRLNNFDNKVDLNAYNLMPNHFHLLLQQKEERHMQSFLQSLITRYSMYFNRRHKRVGGLSSYPNYLNEIHQDWVKPDNYQAFVEGDDIEVKSVSEAFLKGYTF